MRQALGYRIPSAGMPGSALREPASGQPAPPDQTVFGQRVDCVLATSRNKAARCRSQRRNHVPVQLDQKDQPTDQPPAAARGQAHRCVPDRSKARRNPVRSCCSSHADEHAATRQCPDHHLVGPLKIAQHVARDMAQPTGDPMTLDGRTHRFGDDQPNARTVARLVVAPPPDVNDDVGLHRAQPVFHRRVEFSRPPHAVACGKHGKTQCCDQADSARRPLRRRPDTIARPARVRIRRRKPCTRARRRLFGWKVRLPLATAYSSSYQAQ